MAIGLDEVTLVSMFVECVLYGLFIFLFAVSAVIILRRRGGKAPGERLNVTLLSVSVTMFLLATVHVGADLKRMLQAFLTHGADPRGPVGFLGQVNTVLYSIKSTAYCIQTLVGDGFMVYRLYLVWNGNRLVVFPVFITFIASIGVGIGALQGFARVSPDAPVFITELHDWIVSFFSLTLFTNFTSTALIAGRIWWVQSKVTGFASGRGRLGPAAVVIIESGSIYSVCLILLLSLYLSGSYAQYIMLDAVTQVVGIVFSLVIVRVALGVSSDATTQPTAVHRPTMLSVFHAASQRPKDTWQSTVRTTTLDLDHDHGHGHDRSFMAVRMTQSQDTDATAAATANLKTGAYSSWDDHEGHPA